VIGIPEDIILKPTVETLYFLTNKLACNFPFTNIQFWNIHPVMSDLNIEAIYDRAIIKRDGALCFEY